MAGLTWPPSELAKLERGLIELADSVRTRPAHRTDDEQIWLTRLLVVRSCGYAEQVLYQCAIRHLEWRSGGTARSYALSWLERSINPSIDNIVRTLGRFDATLADEFDQLCDHNNGELRNDLSALVSRRHGIAHGLNEGMGSQRALALCDVARFVADWLILKLNPDPARGSSYSR